MRRVLLVEDEVIMRKIYRSILSSAGFDPYCAASVPEAIDALRRYEFDVIVSDYNLFNQTGDLILSWISINRPTLRDRFLFVTGDPGQVRHLDTPILEKPFNYQDLLVVLDALC